jgi:hypothetical protein
MFFTSLLYDLAQKVSFARIRQGGGAEHQAQSKCHMHYRIAGRKTDDNRKPGDNEKANDNEKAIEIAGMLLGYP